MFDSGLGTWGVELKRDGRFMILTGTKKHKTDVYGIKISLQTKRAGIAGPLS